MLLSLVSPQPTHPICSYGKRFCFFSFLPVSETAPTHNRELTATTAESAPLQTTGIALCFVVINDITDVAS